MFLTLDEVVAYCQNDLGMEVQSDIPTFNRWVVETLNEIGYFIAVADEKDFEFDRNCRVELPEGFTGLDYAYAVKDGVCYDLDYGATANSCKTGCGTTNNHSVNGLLGIKPVINIKDGHFEFSDDIKDFDHVKISYNHMPVELGMLLIPAFAKPAIYAYMDYMHMKQIRRKNQAASASRNNPVNITEIREAQDTWRIECKAARAHQKMPSFQKLVQIGNAHIYSFTNSYPPSVQMSGVFLHR